ncbi:metallopeptidase, catalytic domain-containing protein [Tanacetum coccineum]
MHDLSAFDEWASGSGYFTFSRVADIATSDLKISFEKMNHGHREEFDGPNGVLAHAFSPTDGRLHFDEDENWSLGPGSVPNTYDFKTVTVHEIGHLLGLQIRKLSCSLLSDLERVTTRKSRTGDEVFPGDICRPGKPTKRQKSVRRGTNSDRTFQSKAEREFSSRATCRRDKLDEMLRLQGLGSNTPTGVPYTEDEIMAIVRRGAKQLGAHSGVGRVFPGRALQRIDKEEKSSREKREEKKEEGGSDSSKKKQDNSFEESEKSGIEEMQLNTFADISRMTTSPCPCEDLLRDLYVRKMKGSSVASIRMRLMGIDETDMRKISSWWKYDYSDVNSYEEWRFWFGPSIRIQSKLKGVS